MITRVDFDIAVAAEAAGGGRGGLKVFAVAEVEGGGCHKTGYANQIKFSVPVMLPRSKS